MTALSADLALLLRGAWLTIFLTVTATLIGLPLAACVVAMRRSGFRVLRWLAIGYSILFRGMPLLVTLYLVYFGLGQFALLRQGPLWPILRDAQSCALIAMSLVTAAYVGEFVNGALDRFPLGLAEAARALGLSRAKTFRLVTLPVTLRMIIPLYTNEIILLLKGSSLVSTITLIDLTGAANQIFHRSYDPYFPFLAAGAIYLCLCLAVSAFGRRLQRWNAYPQR